MAHADLKALWALVPAEACAAYQDGDELRSALLLRRARERQRVGTPGFAVLERLEGLLLIAVQREVEGTFALERADTVLDTYGLTYPDLEWLEERG